MYAKGEAIRKREQRNYAGLDSRKGEGRQLLPLANLCIFIVGHKHIINIIGIAI